MRSYERNGVMIDQCSECRGLFLDRGELERLVDAENAWHGERRPKESYPPAFASGDVPRHSERRHDDDDDDDDRRHHGDRHHTDQRHYKQKQRGGFLEDLFG